MTNLDKYTKHHILPTSMHGSSDPCNLELLKKTTHQSIHTLFQNQMIAEQLITTVTLSEQALRDDVKDRLLEVLTSKDIYDPYVWYKDKCIK